MNPILFLDIDGVLNSEEWMVAGNMRTRDEDEHLCPAMCARLDRVLRETGAAIVLSSAWRYNHSPALMQERLRRRGVSLARVIDRTPLGREMGLRVIPIEGTGSRMYQAEIRGNEIQWWLDAHRGGSTERIAIVDDSADMGHLAPWLVQTTWQRGIEDEHVDALVAMLSADTGTPAEEP